jgi:hypothetical protein
MVGCKSGRSPLEPIIPDSNYQFPDNNRIIPDHRSIGSTDRTNVRLILTGPEEIFTSRLSPPRITSRMPTFTVRVVNNKTPLNVDDFTAMIDAREVGVNLIGDTVSFMPSTQLDGGKHRAELKFKNPDGYPQTFTCDFILNIDPPVISNVFMNRTGGVIVFFDKEVEPAYLTDSSRWKLNGYSGVLHRNLQIFNMSNMIVQFAFAQTAFDGLKMAGTAELSFTDNVGTAVYEVDATSFFSRGGQACDPCPPGFCETCANVNFCFCDGGSPCGNGEVCRHEPLENEDYAIAWKLVNQNHCKILLQLTDVNAYPVANSDPESVPYDQSEDLLTVGQVHHLCDPTSPLMGGPYISTLVDESGTLKFPANWKHEIDWEVLCTSCENDQSGCAVFSTSTIASGHFDFNSAFDETNPDFPDLEELGITTTQFPNPAVMYGYELADYLEEIFTSVPLFLDSNPDYYDPPNVNGIHCYGKSRDIDLEGIAGELAILREFHSCDLFVFAAAEDKAPVSTNHKRIFPVMGLQVHTIDEYGVEETTWNGYSHFIHLLAGLYGWECDFNPWGALDRNPATGTLEPAPNFPDDYEIYTEWEDLNHKEVPDCFTYPDDCDPGFPGHLMQDYNKAELVFQWWNLTEELQGKEDYQLVDIRVRIEDEVQDPDMENCPPDCADFFYNWQRSDDVLSQLCTYCSYRGSNRNVAHMVDPYPIKVRFVNDNPYDYKSNGLPDKNWKIVRFDASEITDSSKETSFIYNRSQNDGSAFGDVELDLFILVESDCPPSEYIPIQVEFSSSESVFPENCDQTVILEAEFVKPNDPILMKMTDNFDPVHPCARINELFEPNPDVPTVQQCPKYYHAKLIISDDKLTKVEDKILYLSSRDHKLSDKFAKMDYSISIGTDPSMIEYPHPLKFSFGTRREIGMVGGDSLPLNKPGIDESGFGRTINRWYSWDEYITNGGFENVRAEVVNDKLRYISGEDGIDGYKKYRCVPVQSESDVLIIFSHGSSGPNWIEMGSFSFPYNIYSTREPSWLENAFVHVVHNTELNKQCVSSAHMCSDYWSQNANYKTGWGNFWFKESSELRWLAVMACHSMDTTPLSKAPVKNWVAIINDGYIKSACGFRESPKVGSSHISLYGYYLDQLYKQVGGYESDTAVCLIGNESLYANSSCKSKDLSVAAWMEAACYLYDTPQRRADDVDDCHYFKAAAVTCENGIGYYWYLEPVDKTRDGTVEEQHDQPHKILKVLIN